MINTHFLQNPPLSLYIHIPWCVRKCPYCDFNSHLPGQHSLSSEFLSGVDEKRYVQALLEDLEQDLPLVWGRPIESIFIGGGTPSLFSATSIDQLLSGVRARIPLKPFAEITLEANPGTVEAEKFCGYYQAGITRLSLGIQSFHNKLLQQLGRIHNGFQAVDAFHLARTAGFKQINIDVMFGLPRQDVELALTDLKQATALAPEHLSWYQLTIEPNTRFYSSPPPLPSADLTAEIAETGINFLKQQGYARYEVSAFAQSSLSTFDPTHYQCQHNLNYWQFGDYLGIGAGAHSKITHVPSGKILRRQKTRQPDTYLNPDKAFLASQQTIASGELPLEFMLNALRLPEGVKTRLFQAHTGLNPLFIEPIVKKAVQRQLMKNWPERIQPTALGLRFLNDTLALFFSDQFTTLNPETIPVTRLD